MTSTLCIESSTLAQDLHALLQTIDPTRWRQDMEEAARDHLAKIQRNLRRILDTYKAPPSTDQHLSRLYEGLQALARTLEDLRRPRVDWQALRQRLQPSYAALATTLERLSVPMPALRPTNYGRSLFHVGMGLFSLAMIQFVLSPRGLMMVAVPFAIFCWTMEALRVRYDVITKVFMFFMGRIAHPHEAYRVNSATWYSSALAILSLTVTPMVGAVAVMVLAVADPMAALIGRRYGTIQIHRNRTLEGSLAFVAAGSLIAMVILLAFYPAMGLGAALAISLAASVTGAAAELVSGRLDDNLTIPLAAAAGAAMVVAVIGL